MIIRAIVVFLYHLIFSPFARRVDRLYVLISLRNEWGSLWNIYYANVFLRRKGDKSLNITQKLLQCRLPKVSDIVLACNAKKKIGQIKNYAVFRPNHSIIFHPSSSYEEIIKLMTTKDTRRRRMDGWMDGSSTISSQISLLYKSTGQSETAADQLQTLTCRENHPSTFSFSSVAAGKGERRKQPARGLL